MAKQEIDFSPDNPENAELIGSEGSKEETEVSVGPEPEAKPEVVTLSPEEFLALKASGDSAKAIKEGIEGLSSKLASTSSPSTHVVNAPQQTPDEFYAEHADELFDKEKGAAVLRKYTKMVSEQEYGGILRGLSTTLANTRKELLEAKDAHFRKYKAEVDALVASQPAEVQLQPDIFERAWISVRQKHQAEIEAEIVDDKVAKAVEAKLKELGIDPSKTKSGGERPPVHLNSEGRSVPSISAGQKKSVRLPDEETKARLKELARIKGMDFDDLLRVKGYIQ